MAVRTRSLALAALAAAVILAGCAPVPIGTTVQVTWGSSWPRGLSADGGTLLYEDVLAGPEGTTTRLVAKDLAAGTRTTLVPYGEAGLAGAALSRDGRFATFATRTDLETGTETFTSRVYRWDLATGNKRVVDTDAVPAPVAGQRHLGAASFNGRHLGLVRSDGLVALDVVTGVRRVVSGPASSARFCGISDDGATVLYSTGGVMRLRAMATGTTVASWNLNTSSSTNRWLPCGALSGDGRTVVFGGNSPVLPGGAAPAGTVRVYAWSRTTGATTLVARADTRAVATTESGNHVFFVDMSVEGQEPVFRFERSTSTLSQLDPGQPKGRAAVDLVAGATGRFAAWNDAFVVADTDAGSIWRWTAP